MKLAFPNVFTYLGKAQIFGRSPPSSWCQAWLVHEAPAVIFVPSKAVFRIRDDKLALTHGRTPREAARKWLYQCCGLLYLCPDSRYFCSDITSHRSLEIRDDAEICIELQASDITFTNSHYLGLG